jgi:hypothetical protein
VVFPLTSILIRKAVFYGHQGKMEVENINKSKSKSNQTITIFGFGARATCHV